VRGQSAQFGVFMRPCARPVKFQQQRKPLNSTQRASMDAGVKKPQCPQLSSHFCISNTTINLIRVLICRRFQSGRP